MKLLIEFLKRFAPMLRSGKMSYGDALTRFRAQVGRPAEGVEKAAIMKEVEQAPSTVVQFPKDRITPFHIPRPSKATLEQRAEFLKKYTKDGQPNDVELNALVNEHRILSEEAKKLGDAGENYEKFSQLNKRKNRFYGR